MSADAVIEKFAVVVKVLSAAVTAKAMMTVDLYLSVADNAES